MKLKVDTSVIEMLGAKLYEGLQHIVFVRECVQNSLDAGATRIAVNTNNGDSNTFISVQDDGEGIESFQEHFATIGGSHKAAGSIGGFGIAKLAIMSMDSWRVTSKHGTLTMDCIKNDTALEDEFLEVGTLVSGHTRKRFYYAEDEIRNYLQRCKFGDVVVTLNGNEITPVQTSAVYSNDEIIYQFEGENTLVVRLNGLVMFGKSYYVEGETALGYFYDLETSLTPYEEGYPLSATREAFADDEIKKDFMSVYNDIVANRRRGVELEKRQRAMLHFSPKNNIYYSGDLSPHEIRYGKKVLEKFESYVSQILYLLGKSPSEYRFELIGSNEFRAVFMREQNAFLLNPNAEFASKYDALVVAVHEVSHIYVENHYDEFTATSDRIMTQVLEAIALKEFKL